MRWLSCKIRLDEINVDVDWKTFRCLLNPLGKIVGFGSTKIPVQLCFNSKSKVLESVSKSSAPASMKKPSFNCEQN